MVSIDYFSDVLCIWAYGGQIRVDELQKQFGDRVKLQYRFIPIFAAGRTHVANVWQDEGGFKGFNRHLQEVARQWPHIKCSDNLWLDCQPSSSTTAHVVLKAVALLEEQGELSAVKLEEFSGRSRFEQLMWQVRRAFFESADNVSEFRVLQKLVESVGISWSQVFALIENGEAYAGLHRDDELKRQYCVQGSPSFVFNEGRQILYGNVGYRIIEANINELLNKDYVSGASWC